MNKVFELVTKSIKGVSEEVKEALTETSIKINKAIENLDDKLPEIMKDRGILAIYLMSPLSKITYPDNSSQYKLIKDSSSNRINDLLIYNTIPITLYNKL